VTFGDHVLQRPITMGVDALILSAATVGADTEELASLLKLAGEQRRVLYRGSRQAQAGGLPTPGVYLCGTAHSPMLLRESISQALAAASRASAFLASAAVTIGGAVARVEPEPVRRLPGLCHELSRRCSPDQRPDTSPRSTRLSVKGAGSVPPSVRPRRFNSATMRTTR